MKFPFLFSPSQELEECLNCECDRLRITSSYPSLGIGGDCGRKTPNYQKYVLQARGQDPENDPNGRNIYIRLVTDDSVHYRGFNFTFIVESDRGKWRVRKLMATANKEHSSILNLGLSLQLHTTHLTHETLITKLTNHKKYKKHNESIITNKTNKIERIRHNRNVEQITTSTNITQNHANQTKHRCRIFPTKRRRRLLKTRPRRPGVYLNPAFTRGSAFNRENTVTQ